MAVAAGAIWVACEGSDEVGRIDPATDRMTDTTEVGNEPRFVDRGVRERLVVELPGRDPVADRPGRPER